jgi:hypothetical protein
MTALAPTMRKRAVEQLARQQILTSYWNATTSTARFTVAAKDVPSANPEVAQ